MSAPQMPAPQMLDPLPMPEAPTPAPVPMPVSAPADVAIQQTARPVRSSSPLRRRLDWMKAAELLARGMSVEAAAAELGCSPKVIRRNLRRSPSFRLRIESEHERCRLAAQLRFAALGEVAVEQMQARAEKLDHRLLQWLGERIGFGQVTRGQSGGLAVRLEATMRPGLLPPSGEEAAAAAAAGGGRRKSEPERNPEMTAEQFDALMRELREVED